MSYLKPFVFRLEPTRLKFVRQETCGVRQAFPPPGANIKLADPHPNRIFSSGVTMNINHITLASCMIGVLYLAGCQKASEPPQPTTSASGAAGSQSESVAAPPVARPPSDATIASPAQTAPSSGDAGAPTQVNPNQLTKEQEKTDMPHSGQVNNHSVPDTTSQTK